MKCAVFATDNELFLRPRTPPPHFSNQVLVIKYYEISKNVETCAMHPSTF